MQNPRLNCSQLHHNNNIFIDVQGTKYSDTKETNLTFSYDNLLVSIW